VQVQMAPYMGRGGREEALAPPTEKKGRGQRGGKAIQKSRRQ